METIDAVQDIWFCFQQGSHSCFNCVKQKYVLQSCCFDYVRAKADILFFLSAPKFNFVTPFCFSSKVFSNHTYDLLNYRMVAKYFHFRCVSKFQVHLMRTPTYIVLITSCMYLNTVLYHFFYFKLPFTYLYKSYYNYYNNFKSLTLFNYNSYFNSYLLQAQSNVKQFIYNLF